MKVEIIGCTASGKSTLCKTMSAMGWLAQFEQYEINPFLINFFKEGNDNFENQIFFLLHHYNVMKRSEYLHGRKIYDFSFVLDSLYASILLSDSELHVYYKLMSHIQSQVGQPDYFIKLICPDDILCQRMIDRGRNFEQNVDIKFLQKLNSMVRNCIVKNKLIIVDSSKVNLMDERMVYAEIIKRICR